MATAADRQAGPGPFLREAVGLLRSRRLVLPVAVLAVLLTASNIVILLNLPPRGGPIPPAFAAAALVRGLALVLIPVALLRMMTGSGRRPWLPDAGFWAFMVSFVALAGLAAALRLLLGLGGSALEITALNTAVSIIAAPLAVWFAALAVARPVPWNPAPWMKGWPAWLPYWLFWTLLLLTPLRALHAAIDLRLIDGAGDLFWPLALFDGALSTLMAVLGLALGAAAYRRVARG